VLREINKANREHAHRLLHCLTVAIRPLRVEELAEILAVDFDAARQGGIPKLNSDWRWADQHQAAFFTCSSLIMVDDGDSQVVPFSHFSVKEFLTSDRLARSSEDVSRYHILLEPAHTLLAQACLGVLLRLDDTVQEQNVWEFPLAEYAARYWVDHAGFEGVSSRISEAMKYFFDVDKPHWAAWIRVHNIDFYLGLYRPFKGAFPLYYAAACGSYDLVEHLIKKCPEHINAGGGPLVAPLGAALCGRHFQVAELLFQHGADVDLHADDDELLLGMACSYWSLDTVLWLLERGADINAQTKFRWTALHYAAFHSRPNVVQALLEHGADINSRTAEGGVPLHLAASPIHDNLNDDQLDAMQLLVNHGSDVNTRDNEGSTPLHHSSYRLWKSIGVYYMGTVKSTRLLLKHGADISAKDKKGRTALQVALEHGRDEIARVLREHSPCDETEHPGVLIGA
jgi:ankyrin repeat protein